MASPSTHRDLYEQVREDHKTLRNLLRQADSMIHERTVPLAEIGQQLDRLRDQLVTHFQGEEEGGYLAEALQLAPWLAPRADTLLGQHGKLTVTVTRLAQGFWAAAGSDDAREQLQKEFSVFMAELIEHEQTEDRLLLEAFQLDLGAAD